MKKKEKFVNFSPIPPPPINNERSLTVAGLAKSSWIFLGRFLLFIIIFFAHISGNIQLILYTFNRYVC